MKLYHIQFDGESYWVEAERFADAVTLWKSHIKVLWGEDFDATEEPESVHLVHDNPVIRQI